MKVSIYNAIVCQFTYTETEIDESGSGMGGGKEIEQCEDEGEKFRVHLLS
jgi:hypothetical protein